MIALVEGLVPGLGRLVCGRRGGGDEAGSLHPRRTAGGHEGEFHVIYQLIPHVSGPYGVVYRLISD